MTPIAPQLNIDIARRFRDVARLLWQQGANPYRVAAYRHAADMLDRLPESVAEILRERGVPGLESLPGIGGTHARVIQHIITTGRLPMLDRLRGEVDALALFQTVPGIGRQLGRRLHDEFGLETLEELEAAAYDGRLKDVFGLGEKTIEGIQAFLGQRLERVRDRGGRSVNDAPEASIAELLDVDREYRKKAAAGLLPTIAARRFNPDRKAWLPILHTERGRRHYTALFSNTARAHQLGRTNDWVILYYDGRNGERQCTIVTAHHDPMRGMRLVRGREEECAVHYAVRGTPTQIGTAVV